MGAPQTASSMIPMNKIDKDVMQMKTVDELLTFKEQTDKNIEAINEQLKTYRADQKDTMTDTYAKYTEVKQQLKYLTDEITSFEKKMSAASNESSERVRELERCFHAAWKACVRPINIADLHDTFPDCFKQDHNGFYHHITPKKVFVIFENPLFRVKAAITNLHDGGLCGRDSRRTKNFIQYWIYVEVCDGYQDSINWITHRSFYNKRSANGIKIFEKFLSSVEEAEQYHANHYEEHAKQYLTRITGITDEILHCDTSFDDSFDFRLLSPFLDEDKIIYGIKRSHVVDRLEKSRMVVYHTEWDSQGNGSAIGEPITVTLVNGNLVFENADPEDVASITQNIRDRFTLHRWEIHDV
jgi:hypothetical protein